MWTLRLSHVKHKVPELVTGCNQDKDPGLPDSKVPILQMVPGKGVGLLAPVGNLLSIPELLIQTCHYPAGWFPQY